MAEKSQRESAPDLREILKENDQRLYDFCIYMLYGTVGSDDLVISIFREFGERYRRLSGSSDTSWMHLEIRLRLFRVAWDRIREAVSEHTLGWTVGRDTRYLQSLEEDILKRWTERRAQVESELESTENAVLERLSRIEPEFRVTVVLRDILGFDDEEVVRILGIRWGVYRHRLHRGRMEFCEALRGRLPRAEARGFQKTL